MALNILEVNAQVALLQQQSAAASHTARLLSLYKLELLHFWSGEEVDCLCRVLEAQLRDCETLYEELYSLCSDMVLAVKSIQSQGSTGTLGT